MLLRTEEQAKLAELHGFGSGMLTRYRELLDGDPHHVTPFLRTVVDRRGPLLERVAAAEAARAELPSTGDLEINELRALGDRVLAALFGENTLDQRIQDAEREWQALLEGADGLAWQTAERQLLDDLKSDSRASLRLLETLVDQ